MTRTVRPEGISIASMAVGEMMASPRVYEYIGAIAPKGQEGLYLGYQSLPIALASIIGGPSGAGCSSATSTRRSRRAVRSTR